jgi:Protein of unknown function (DUF2452)
MADEQKNIGKEIDVSLIDLDKMKEKTAENPGLLPYAHTVGGVTVKPVDEGSIKANALEAMYQQTDMHMQQIYEQMQGLARQAKEIQLRKELSERIYLAQMRFNPLIGREYYLYERGDGSDVLSLVAPHEWGRSRSYQRFIAKARLLADHTWEVLEAHF